MCCCYFCCRANRNRLPSLYFSRLRCRGAAIGVELAESAVPKAGKVFGTEKCTRADHAGRWVNLNSVGRLCKAPYCTGASEEMLFDYDWVRPGAFLCVAVITKRMNLAYNFDVVVARREFNNFFHCIRCDSSDLQDGDKSRHWVFVPYDCYYVIYNKESLYKCAAATDTKWILAMGDSQEREFVAIMKNINGSREAATKFEDVSGLHEYACMMMTTALTLMVIIIIIIIVCNNTASRCCAGDSLANVQ